MRVCIATHLFPVRSETFVREHVIELARSGFDVSVVSAGCGQGIEQAELEQFADLKISLIYIDPIEKAFGTIRAVARFIQKNPRLYREMATPKPWNRREIFITSRIAEKISSVEADVLHVHFGTLAARLNRLFCATSVLPPMITTWHGYDANIIPRVRDENIYRNFFKRSGIHTIGSTYMRNRLLNLGADEQQIFLVPMGVDLTKFTYSKRTILTNAPLKLLSVGRLTEAKGHVQLIKAVRELTLKGIAVQLRIAGEGELRSTIESLIQDYSLQQYITLLGAIPSNHVKAELHAADLFVLTGIETDSGRVETQGVVFAEAQATGLPVIGSSVGGVPDSLLDGRSGILCQPGDINSIVNAIEKFARNPELLNVFGANGRSFVEENFSLSTMCSKFAALYDKVAHRAALR